MNNQLFIGGQWKNAVQEGTYDVLNPATETVFARIAYGGRVDAQQAIDAASKAFMSWKNTNSFLRAKYLKKVAVLMREKLEEFASFTTKESGKPLAQSIGEWRVAADVFEWFSEEAKRTYGTVIPTARNEKRASVIWQPIGVVGTITAWNFPVWNLARPWAAALAAGCTIVAKPSEFTPISAILLTQILEQAKIPKGVVNLVNGDAEAIAAELLENKQVKKIHFVGSTRVGKLLMNRASITNTKMSLELGGNAPVIVFDDVSVKEIASQAAIAKFRNCGQVCVSPQRFFVQENIYEEFIKEFTATTKKFKVGNGLSAKTQIGPLINKKQQNSIHRIVEEDTRNGAEIVLGGKLPNKKGYYYPPTILKNVNKNSKAFKDEIFGPVVPFIPFSSLEKVISLANKTEYGLAAYVFTNRLQRAIKVSEELDFGMVGINEWTIHGTETPFLGWKQSGVGSELGPDGIYEYMEKKLISIGSL